LDVNKEKATIFPKVGIETMVRKETATNLQQIGQSFMIILPAWSVERGYIYFRELSTSHELKSEALKLKEERLVKNCFRGWMH
jgi:hypothetical protein